MLTLKNPFAKTPPEPTPISPSPAAEASVKGRQLARGRTRARFESLRAELEAARGVLAQSERVDADEDSTAVLQRMTRAEEDVRDKEKELTIAIRKDEAALIALKDAERLVAVETEAAACADLLALAPEWEAVFLTVSQLAIKTASRTEALRVSGGNEKFD